MPAAIPKRANRALALKEWINSVADKHAGRLSPDMLVKEAKNPRSPGHSFFNWSDAAAAHQHRLYQARVLIAGVTVKVETEHRTYTAVAYVRDPRLPDKVQGYVQTSRIRSDSEYAHEVLVEEFARAASHLRRAYDVADALGVRGDVGEIIEKVDTILNRLPEQAAAD